MGFLLVLFTAFFGSLVHSYEFYYQEKNDGGLIISDGDVPHLSYEGMLGYYKEEADKLLVDVISGPTLGQKVYNIWPEEIRNNLTYCISDDFGDHKKNIVSLLKQATLAWSEHGNVTFIHQKSEDNNCTPENINVVFDINKISGVLYLARAFLPDFPRSDRNIRINEFILDNNKLLLGVLKHEIGHVLGFRHEHTFHSENDCFEDKNFAPLTQFDVNSVMFYPQCGGGSQLEELDLTDFDRKGMLTAYPYKS